MTQILSGITSEGIMVATDSMATAFDAEGNESHFSVDKLFSIASHAFIVSGGMGVSVQISKRFKAYVEARRFVGIEAIVSRAGPFLSEECRAALREEGCTVTRGNDLNRIYFVVGGYSFRSREEPYKLALWGSEKGHLPLQRIQIGPCLAVPRTLSGEMKLMKMCQKEVALPEFVEFARQFLQRLSEINPQVGPPFIFGTVTPSGFFRLENLRESSEV